MNDWIIEFGGLSVKSETTPIDQAMEELLTDYVQGFIDTEGINPPKWEDQHAIATFLEWFGEQHCSSKLAMKGELD